MSVNLDGFTARDFCVDRNGDNLGEHKASHGRCRRIELLVREPAPIGEVTLGVGDGRGNLFVHGSPEAIEIVRKALLHRCSLPDSIQEALNSGDGVYRP